MKVNIFPQPNFEKINGEFKHPCNNCGLDDNMKYCGVVATFNEEGAEPTDFSMFACSEECKEEILKDPRFVLESFKEIVGRKGYEFDVDEFLKSNSKSDEGN